MKNERESITAEILDPDDLMEILGTDRETAEWIINQVNVKMRLKGLITIKDRVLLSHLEKALGLHDV